MSTHSLKAQWGDPPKPNLWKVEHSVDHENNYKKWAVTSPAMVGAVILLNSKNSSPEWWVNYYYDKEETHSRSFRYKRIYSYFAHKNGEMTDAECVEHFLSERFYREVFTGFLKKGVIELKVPKVASSKKLEAQWGDPAKPNLWKVEYNKALGQYTIMSPVLEGSFVIKMYPPSSAEIRFFDFTRGVTFAKYLSPVTIGDILSRQFYLEEIKPAIYLTHEVRLKKGLKVASSNLQAMWGDPPKPNLWKVETLQRSKMVGVTRVISPILEGSIWLGVYGKVMYSPDDMMPSPLTEEKMRAFENSSSMSTVLDITKIMGINPKRQFLSNKFYLEHLAPLIGEGRIKLKGNVKVASSNLRAQWGDPPKANLWLVEELMYGWEKIYRVLSPLLEGEIWLSNSLLVYYFPKGLGLPQRKLGLDYDLREIDFGDSTYPMQRLKSADSKEHFLSHAYWSEHLKGNLNLKTNKLAFKGETK